MQQAWQQVMSSHPLLRTACRWEKLSKPVLIVYRHVEQPWQIQDWSNLSQIQQEERLSRWLEQDRIQGFDLGVAPLIHMLLTRIGTKRYRWVWSMHHLLLDGWSSALLLHEILDCYHMLSQGQDPVAVYRRPYRDYLLWLQHLDQTGSNSFWREYLRGFKTPTTVCLPVTGQARSSQERFGEATVSLPVETTRALQQLAQQAHVTLNTLVQGAWAILLSRYSGETDIVFGVTLSGRPTALEQVETMVGLFINTLPLRLEVPQNRSVWSWLPEVQSQQVELLTYQHSSLSQIQSQSEVPGGTPLFESIVVFENYPLPTNRGWERSLSIGDLHVFERTNYPLNLLAHARQGLTLRLFYSDAKISKSMSYRMLGHLQTILEGMLAAPQCPIGRLPFLTRAEEQQLLDWNQTKLDYPGPIAIHQQFEHQASRRPDAIALVFEDQQLSYAALDQRANQLAHHLQELGVGPEVLVGIYMERSIELVIGIVAILKAGGAYLALDPSYPAERLAFMLEDARVELVLTHNQWRASLPSLGARRLLCVDELWPLLLQESTSPPSPLFHPLQLACIIYTSGSTGRPKASMLHHQGLHNELLWMRAFCQLGPDDVVLQKTSISFDAAVGDVFWPLVAGARLVLARPGGHRETDYLHDVFEQQHISFAFFVPSMLQAFLMDQPRSSSYPHLRHLICGGEVLSPELQQQAARQLSAQVHNLYGPTETSLHVTFWPYHEEQNYRSLPIGRPIANAQIHLLDAHLQPVPVGITGELYIGGAGVARGYLGQPDLTAERFVPDPFSQQPGARLYRTGDLAFYREDGAIEFVGRIDHQIKLRGQRIELGEIEAILRELPEISEAVVLLRRDLGKEPCLVAYLVEQEEQPLQVTEIRQRLQQRLPDYMVPAIFLLLQKLPLSPNGKIDRHALPAPENTRTALPTPFQEPHTATEQIIARAWISVLGLDRIGIHDNFFDLGGDSLTSLRVISLASESGVRITPRQMTKYQTIAQLAEHATLITSASEGKNITGPLPMLPTQAYYLLSAPDEDPHIFNSLVLLE
ncbi:MAG TPA: amino acid adenylation domain-containing protein, partial [Ktedonobacteraceae bacterium]|nr:amino acid adenylation domain-containing protein [Ktedonobacteraceae bacterium]